MKVLLACDLKLYVENDEFSSTDNSDNIFILTNSNEYDELKNLKNKDFTLEVSDDMDKIIDSCEILEEVLQ